MEESIVTYIEPQTPNFFLHLLPYVILHPQIKLSSLFIILKEEKKSKIQNSFIITKIHLPFQSQPQFQSNLNPNLNPIHSNLNPNHNPNPNLSPHL